MGAEWRKIVCGTLWRMDDYECHALREQFQQEKLLFRVLRKPYYVIRWLVSDLKPKTIYTCRIMAELVCGTSLLEATGYRLKYPTIGARLYELCDLGIEENVMHLFMQCPHYENNIIEMYHKLKNIDDREITIILHDL